VAAGDRLGLLSFTNWNGIGSIGDAKFLGLKNYHDVTTIYPPFWPAVRHNLIWLAVTFLVATPLGMFLAVLLDKEMRGSRIYQTSFYLPVVLSLALVGFIWQLEAAKVDGANERTTFFKIVLPRSGAANRRRHQHHRPGRLRHRIPARLRPGLGHQQGPQRIGVDRHLGHAEHRG
jgi:ABC-type sugar transport system permease subunit